MAWINRSQAHYIAPLRRFASSERLSTGGEGALQPDLPQSDGNKRADQEEPIFVLSAESVVREENFAVRRQSGRSDLLVPDSHADAKMAVGQIHGLG